MAQPPLCDKTACMAYTGLRMECSVLLRTIHGSVYGNPEV